MPPHAPSPDALLATWLERRDAEAHRRIEGQIERLENSPPDTRSRALLIAYGRARRYVPQRDLAPTEAERADALVARPGWDPRRWTLLDAARTRLLLHGLPAETEPLQRCLATLAHNADLRELVALYQALPLLPQPEAHRALATEGLRTNVKAVFCAIAHHNPYPREQLPEPAWNQMVLKALFIGVALAPIQGLLERANPRLSDMLSDYAHERQAAGRSVPAELWAPLAAAPTEAALADLQRALASEDTSLRATVRAAIERAGAPGARALLQRQPDAPHEE